MAVRVDFKKRCAELEEQLQEARRFCEELVAENEALRAEINSLKTAIESIREKLDTNSSNSSKPPSQDPFRKKRTSKGKGKRQGGQPGHRGHKRKPYPPEQVGEFVDLRPETCPSCSGKDFEEKSVSVEIRQVIELPPMTPDVTQYQIHTCACSCCGKRVRANVPEEAERGFGPRLMGFLTMLSGEGHLSKRKICAVAQHLGIRISLGTLCNIHKLASDLLLRPAEAIRDHVLNTEKVNADETSWRVLNKKCWVWIGASLRATFFKIDPSRSAAAYLRVFGDFKGTLTTDRYGAYNQHDGKKQSCLAHIDRYFAKMSQRPSVDGSCGRILEQQLDEIFRLWREFKAGRFSRKELQAKATDSVENIKVTLMFVAREGKNQKSRALSYDLLDRFETLWTFLYEEGVEPTNNLAERGLRPTVILRKLSNGSQSAWGAEFVERLMTVTCTMKQNSKNLFVFLTELFKAHQQARCPPPLPL